MPAFPTNEQVRLTWFAFCAVGAVVIVSVIINWHMDREQFNDCVQREVNLGAHWQIAERLCEMEIRE